MKNSIYYFVSGIIVVVFGVFIILNPNAVVNIAAFLFSIVLFIKGMRTLINTIRFDSVASKVSVEGVSISLDSRKRVKKTMYINALISLLVGLAALIHCRHDQKELFCNEDCCLCRCLRLPYFRHSRNVGEQKNEDLDWAGGCNRGEDYISFHSIFGSLCLPFSHRKCIHEYLGSLGCGLRSSVFLLGRLLDKSKEDPGENGERRR